MKKGEHVIKKGNTSIDLDNNEKLQAILLKLKMHPYEMMDYEDFKEIGLTESTFKSYISALTTYSDGIYRIAKGCKPSKYIYLPDQNQTQEYKDLIVAILHIHAHANDIISICRENFLRYSDN